MDFTPSSRDRLAVPEGWFELLEWRWPDMIDFVKAEDELMLEMSLPPYATDASAEFPQVAAGRYCFMGTLFVRYPGVVVHGRGEGGRIRVVRCAFSRSRARAIMGEETKLSVEVLQGLLDIRSDILRTLMGLVLREITRSEGISMPALEALHALLATELQRHFDKQVHTSRNGRLAAWRYQRIRARLFECEQPPSNDELAALCGLSARHLNRQFHALTGSTLGAYVEDFRMERARALLGDHEQPIKAIAARLGYAHANSFARAFSKATGMTPREFRQRER